MDLTEKARRCREFIEALDEERRKIQLFQRELPLCLHLVEQTIESYKRMADLAASPREPREPQLLKDINSFNSNSTVASEGNRESSTPQEASERRDSLMANTALPNSKDIRQVPERPIAVKAMKNWGDDAGRLDINKEWDTAAVVPMEPSSNEANSSEELDEEHCGGSDANGEGMKDAKSPGSRKSRRCWSEELHRRFLDAIQQLGGCDAATPKQIRQVMKVDSLTNDEVKSHLQKFRLHSRRNRPNGQGSNYCAPSAHFVLVGGIWIPPSTTSSAADESHPTGFENVLPASGAFTPVLSLPSNLVFQDLNSQQLLDIPLNMTSPIKPLHEHNRAGNNCC